jgi:hypothetical protein
MHQFEREKLRHLANLYNLNLKEDLACPILYKTKYTTQTICVNQISVNRLSAYKRLRKTSLNFPNSESEIDNKYANTMSMNHLSNTKSPFHFLKYHKTFGNWEINKMVTELPIKLRTHNFNYSKSS